MPDRDLHEAMLEIVRERMAERDLSVNRLAALTGLTQQTLDGHLKGRGSVGLDEWDAIAGALEEPLADLLQAARRRV